MKPINRRRLSVLIGSVFAVSSLLAVGVGSAAAGCGWPNCNPAQLSATYTKSITPPGGQAGNITVHFQSTESYPGLETWVVWNGTSYAKWLGHTPFNAAAITLTDHLHVDGVIVTVSLPPGFTGGGSDASFTNTIYNNWPIYHQFNNVTFTCFICYGIQEDATATFQFGTSFYTISAHDQASV